MEKNRNSKNEVGDLLEKEKKLAGMLEEYTKENVCVAFSGGVDSSLLLVLACDAADRNGTKVYAITADTVLHPSADLAVAKDVLAKTSAVHEILKINELKVPEIKYNPENRCYLCKKEIYSRMLSFAEQNGCNILLEGSNEDDLHVYRPGLQAVRELGVKSPLAACGISIKEVRALAAKYDIKVANRPSSPCLATRLPYGAEIDMELLKRIDEAENALRVMGFGNVRVRVHGEIVRLEVDIDNFREVFEEREKIIAIIKNQGFRYVTLDLEGFRSGSMDK